MKTRLALPLIVTIALAVTAVAQPLPNAGPDGLRGLCRIQDFKARRESSSHEDLHKNGDARSVAKGETIVLAELDGPGVISHIWTTVGSYDPFWGRSLVIRMYWDGAAKPSVESPLGDFFGVGHGAAANFTSLCPASS